MRSTRTWSVYDNVAFGLKLRKMPKDEIRRRVGQAARSWGSNSFWNANPASYQAASASAVAVGRAIVPSQSFPL